jgi:hypothetical protein
MSLLDLFQTELGDDESSSSESSSDSSVGSDDEVTVKGAGDKIVDSFKGILVGFVCFLASWAVLWCGATRTELGKEYKKAVSIEGAKEGSLVFLTGIPAADEIGDGDLLKKGKYLKISKEIQYYAVKSTEKSETKKQGTKDVTTKWYEYSLEWTSSPSAIKGQDKTRWKDFAKTNKLQEGMVNPTATEDDKKVAPIYSANCKVNDYSIDIKAVDFKSGSKEIDTIYLKGEKDKPKVGDKRVKYSGYPSDIQYTFSGELKGKVIATHLVDNKPLILASPGDANQLMGDLKSEDRLYWWLFLIIGFVLMSVGLNGMVGPITTLLDFIPYVGEFGASAIRFVLTLVAAVLSVVFYLLVYYWWIVLIIVAAVIGFLIYRKKMAPPKAAAA